MFDYTVSERDAVKCIAARGRIDALSASEIQSLFESFIVAGERVLLVDMSAVNYVSSAGLRVFISTQKALIKADGEIILISMAGPVYEVFKMSGLVKLFRIVKDYEDVAEMLNKKAGETTTKHCEINGISIDYHEKEVVPGTMRSLGSQEKTENSSYTEADVVAVGAADMPFGCGLATLGDTYDEYKDLFGESMVVDRNFFFYPAVKHPSVDYLLNAHENPGQTYKFLHGFGFRGDYRFTLSFQSGENPVTLTELVGSFFSLSRADILGLVFMAETKGIWGLHIKKTPVAGNGPANGMSIFDGSNFADWIDYPIEPSCANHIVVATGIAVRDRSVLGKERESLMAKESTFHIHGGIFDKAPMGKNVHAFNKELSRVFSECQVYKVQHLLGQSRFSTGMAGIVEIG